MKVGLVSDSHDNLFLARRSDGLLKKKKSDDCASCRRLCDSFCREGAKESIMPIYSRLWEQSWGKEGLPIDYLGKICYNNIYWGLCAGLT